jgi:hypothetical protein
MCLLEILVECLGKDSWYDNKCVLVNIGSCVVALIFYAPFFGNNVGAAFGGCRGGVRA